MSSFPSKLNWLRIVVLLVLTSTGTFAKKLAKVKSGITYKPKDEVHIIVNSLGPFNNPVEKYRYYSLPFCTDHEEKDKKGGVKHKQRFHEGIAGDRRESSPYVVTYGESINDRVLCTKKMTKGDLGAFKHAIDHSYFFEMYVEDLPVYGFVGEVQNEDFLQKDITGADIGTTFMFTHYEFEFGMNDGKIVSASIRTDQTKTADISNINVEQDIKFTYSIKWFEDPLEWKDRLKVYANSTFAQPRSLEIHWLSIINSCVLVTLLMAFLAIIFMRILKNDFARYMDIEEDAIDEEESGWKLISGDVFRHPKSPTIFCAAVGVGTQLMVTTFVVLLRALTGKVSTTRRGSILACAFITYALTSVVGGYVSTKLYFQMNGKAWARCVVVAALLFPLPVALVFAWANSVAMAHGSISALPIGAIFTMLCLYGFVSLPLTLLGGIFAKQYSNKDMEAPTRTTKVAREIPTEGPIYSSRFVFMLIAGFLPFTAIYVELHYTFTSMWGHQLYTMFGVLFCAFCLLVVVTSAITISLIYFQLSREDHRWWWSAFINGGMIGSFIYAYAFYFYFFHSGMSGFLQASFYFGYMAIISFALFLMLGSTGFRFSFMFVKYIYSRVKCD